MQTYLPAILDEEDLEHIRLREKESELEQMDFFFKLSDGGSDR